MILRPINAYPSNNVSVDANEVVEFSSIIEGSSSVVSSYQVDIYEAETHNWVFGMRGDCDPQLIAGDKWFTRTKLSNASITNGGSYYWRLRLYQDVADIFVTNSVIQYTTDTQEILIRAHNNVEAGMYLKIGNEMREITGYTFNYDGTLGVCYVDAPFTNAVEGTSCTIYKNYVESLQFPFYTRETPTLTISTPEVAGSTVNMRKVTFKMNYSAMTESPIKWYRVVIRNQYTGELFDDSGKIYNSGLSYTTEGFLTDTTYAATGYVFNSDNTLISTTVDCVITVEYNEPSMEIVPTVKQITMDDAVAIQWEKDQLSEPEKDSTTIQSFSSNGMLLENGSIYYNKVSNQPFYLRREWTIFSDITISEQTDGEIISRYDDTYRETYSLYMRNNKIYYQLGNRGAIEICDVLPQTLSGQQDKAVSGVNYIWMDSDTWNDIKYWVETLAFQKRYKITMSPNEATVLEVT